MTRRWMHAVLLAGLLPGCVGRNARAAEASAGALSAFRQASLAAEVRLAQQHRSAEHFLAGENDPSHWTRLRGGEIVLENLAPAAGTEVDGAMLHHWRGTVFVPGATAAECENLLRDFGNYPRLFEPDVTATTSDNEGGGHYRVSMRMRQKHVLTVVLNATYEVRFGRLDAAHEFSESRSTSIDEIASPGMRTEHVLSSADAHGFLWRQNTYWSWEQRDNGVLVQMETVSLSRDVPSGLGWIVRPYVESVPRESIAFTLGRVSEALRK